jgi:hypothetical protein
MTLERQIAVVTGMIEFVRRLEALITEAIQRTYAAHVEKTQMRLAPVKLPRNRTRPYRDWQVLNRNRD